MKHKINKKPIIKKNHNNPTNQPPNLHAKIKQIQSQIPPLIRTEENKHQNYKYFDELQILKALKPLLDEYDLVLYLSDDTTQPFLHEKDGNFHIIKYCKKLEIWDCETEESLAFSFWAGGQNPDLAKAKGAAETYAIKYILSKLFLIKVLDQDDPDLVEDSTLEAESQEKKAESIPEPTKKPASPLTKEFSPRLTATIRKLKDKTDKYGQKYLLLGLDSQANNIFVFPQFVPETQWTHLKEGQTYNFELSENEKGVTILNGFERVDYE
ncbi:MAG: single-stranded DNA-binding protein [Mycoplasmataceae bacterium RV_VA103A]|nr:MAG: single-stranded DNA-binding protein [Mycoplasmataceae bacterium RV_VA103A]